MGGFVSKGNNNENYAKLKEIFKLVSGVVDLASNFSYAGTNISEVQKKDYMENLAKYGPISKETLLAQMQAKGYPKIHGKSQEDVDKILETMALSIPSNIELPDYVKKPSSNSDSTGEAVTGGNPIYTVIAQGVISVANSEAGQRILTDVNDSAKKIVDDPGGYVMRIHKTLGPEAMVSNVFESWHKISQAQTQHKIKQAKAQTELNKLEFRRLKSEGYTDKQAIRIMKENSQKNRRGLFTGMFGMNGGNEITHGGCETILVAKIVILVLFVIAFAVYFTYESPAARNATLSLGGIYILLFLFEKFY